MFSFFKKKSSSATAPFSLDFMESDWHCHALPGIDDGAPDEKVTLEMLQEYVQLGIKKIVATPHVRADYFKNTVDTIRAAAAKTNALIETHSLPLTLEASAEYYADENFLQLINNDQLLPIENQYILFEFSMQAPSLWGHKLIEKIQQKGYTPLLAHPERYRYWHGKPREWQSLKNRGVSFQLNLLSLVGQYGSAERKAAEQLIEKGYYEAFGTDAHGIHHLQKLKDLGRNPHFDTLQQLPLLNRLG